MNEKFNLLLNKMKPSASMSKGLIEGVTKHNLAIGSPDIPPPSEISELIKDFAKKPDYQYQPTKGGIDTIKNVINLVDRTNEQFNLNKNVVLTPGAKYGIYLALKTVCNIGDHVVLVEPYWLSYTDICESLGLKVSFWEPIDNIYTFNDIKHLIEKSINRPRVIVINNPINPSGYIFDSKLLDSIINYCYSNDIWVILDEVYKDLCFDINKNLHKNLFSNNLIRIGSFSKSLAIPGFRSGYILGSESFITKFNLLHQHIATSINSLTGFILRYLSFQTYTEYTQNCSLIYKKRYEICYRELLEKGYKPIKSDATFYMIFDVSDKFENGQIACDYFETQGILLTAGINYGKKFNKTVRICLTKEIDILYNVINTL